MPVVKFFACLDLDQIYLFLDAYYLITPRPTGQERFGIINVPHNYPASIRRPGFHLSYPKFDKICLKTDKIN